MTDNIQYQENWQDQATQCQNCKYYQQKDGQHGCVPEDKTFEQAIEAYGQVSPKAHCNSFEAK